MVGKGGTGTLNVADGGSVTNTYGYLGNNDPWWSAGVYWGRYGDRQLSGYGDISLLVHLGESGEVAGSGSGLSLSGGLTGSGSVSDAVLGGSVDIGNSAGVLELEDVVVDSTAIFGVEIGGTTLADYDRILLAGGVTLDGVMNVSFVDGFEPVNGDTFQLVDLGTATVTGWFSSIFAPTDWSLSPSGQLYSTAVPEPAALLLALLGLALLPRRRRAQ